MRQLTKRLNDETGSAILEFTFTAMILLSLTFAMIDFGRYVYANNVVRAAAQEGARAGISNKDIVAAVNSKLITLDTDRATVSSPPSGFDNTVSVEVTYEFEFITPFLSAGGPIQISGSASTLRFPS